MSKKKETRGRKKKAVSETVMPIQVYATRSKVKAYGGVEKVREKMKEIIAAELG